MRHTSPVSFDASSPVAREDYAFLLLDGFTHLAFACAVEPLRLANLAAGQDLFGWRVLTPQGAPARSSSSLSIAADATLSDLRRRETLVVVAGAPGGDDLGTVRAVLRREAAHGRRIIGICGGVWALAEAGLLENEDCSVHWQVLPAFSERFRSVRGHLTAFSEGKIPTASGGTAAGDLMLAEIRGRFGDQIVRMVADLMLHRSVRGSDAPQTASLLNHIHGRNPKLAQIVALMEENLEVPLGSPELAAAAQLSVRQMERHFKNGIGQSPMRFYLGLRLQRARDLLTQTEMSTTEIALATGFLNCAHFAKTYRRAFGATPHAGETRRNWSTRAGGRHLRLTVEGQP